jgi:hypothetical protein
MKIGYISNFKAAFLKSVILKKYLITTLALAALLFSCNNGLNNNPPIEITQLSREQISLYTVRGAGDYLDIAGVAPNITVKITESSPDSRILDGRAEELSGGGIRFIFSENLGRYGKEIYVTAAEPGKQESLPVCITAELEAARPYGESVKKAVFTGETAAVNFEDLSENDIYLIKVNRADSAVNAANTGNAYVLSPDPRNIGQPYETDNKLPPMGHVAARAFNANPPPITRDEPGYGRLRAAFIPPVAGDTRKFWVEKYFDEGNWVEKQATLRASGTHGNIWVADENYSPRDGGDRDGKITTAQAETLAAKFDLIYPAETNLLGFEYGGGPGGDGGKDGDPKVQILICDIVDSSGNVMAAGYFWSKDHYSQAQFGTIKTNLAEIFYLDAYSVDRVPDYMYSTLVHEFQHMINFNVKFVGHNKNSATWYDEMLSTMAEDVIGPLIGIAPSNVYHPIQVRMPTFLNTYNQTSITEWDTLNIASYAKGYAFGAYLMRNYGGAELLGKILANDKTDIDSITAALKEISEELNFEIIFGRYGEALVFSGPGMPEGSLTFWKTVESVVNGTTYTAYGFDIWSAYNSANEKGPLVFGLTPADMKSHSVLLQSTGAWKNRTGDLSITLERPASPNIDLYLMVR